jgi:hypothetical protein
MIPEKAEAYIIQDPTQEQLDTLLLSMDFATGAG